MSFLLLPYVLNRCLLQPKKPLSPGSRAKADKRNARLREKRAATAAASEGAKSGKKLKATADFLQRKRCRDVFCFAAAAAPTPALTLPHDLSTKFS
jgi:hypothetical protein